MKIRFTQLRTQPGAKEYWPLVSEGFYGVVQVIAVCVGLAAFILFGVFVANGPMRQVGAAEDTLAHSSWVLRTATVQKVGSVGHFQGYATEALDTMSYTNFYSQPRMSLPTQMPYQDQKGSPEPVYVSNAGRTLFLNSKSYEFGSPVDTHGAAVWEFWGWTSAVFVAAGLGCGLSFLILWIASLVALNRRQQTAQEAPA
jgi:hypothetical protein